MGCLAIAIEEFKGELTKDPIRKQGDKTSDFAAYIVERDGLCVVAFGSGKKRTGGGIEYWIADGRVIKSLYTK